MADMPEKGTLENTGQTAGPAARKPFRRAGGGGGGQSYRSGGGNQPGDEGGRSGPGGRRGGFFQGRRKVCPIKLEEIDWKNLDALRYFVNESGGIRSRRKTGATAKVQRRAAAAVRRARHMALLPYTGEHVRIQGRR